MAGQVDTRPRPRAMALMTVLAVIATVLASVPAALASPLAPVEAGNATITDAWSTISIQGTFSDPVVVAGPPTRVEADPGIVEIANAVVTAHDLMGDAS